MLYLKTAWSMRKGISNAVRSLIGRLGEYLIDNEPIGEGEINVCYEIEDDYYQRVRVTDVWIYSPMGRTYENIVAMVMSEIRQAVAERNREMEADFLERLTVKERKNYYADIA